MHTLWPKKEQKGEGALFGTCWFDYRTMHPVHRTYLFGHLFIEETRSIIRTYIDNRPPRVLANGRVQDWQPLKDGDIFDPPDGNEKRVAYWQRKTRSLIRARQFIDQLGCPYDIALRHGLRHWYFGRSYMLEQITLPEPGLLNNDQCRDFILEKWVGELESRVQVANAPRYKLSNQVNHPDIAEHQTFLLDQVCRRSRPEFALKGLLAKDVLSREAISQRFGTELLSRVT